MSGRHLLWIPVLLVAASVSGQPQPKPEATAKLINAAGIQVGTATFTPTIRGDAVTIMLKVTNLPVGVHAVHIHAVGKCDPPDFTSAGGHFNPTMKQHGQENPNGHHLGDLPNLETDSRGVATIAYTVPDLTIGPGPGSLFHPGGTAIVIHAQPDDNKTDPSGNAGARIACGVIEKQGS